MSIELKIGDYVLCPHCNHEFDETVDEMKTIDGYGLDNSERIECENCNMDFIILENCDGYIIEEIEPDDEEEFFDEDDES